MATKITAELVYDKESKFKQIKKSMLSKSIDKKIGKTQSDTIILNLLIDFYYQHNQDWLGGA